MMGRWIVIGAVACYALVVGCVILSGNGSGPGDHSVAAHYHSTTVPAGLPYRGVAMQIQRVDWIDKYEKSIDEIADLGADTVLLVIDSRQENGTSSHIYLDMRMTPTPEQLGELIDHAKKRKLRVVLMPIVLLDDPQGTEWRGTLKPDSWDKWFDSYRDMMTQFAWVAQGHGVDVLVVGSELVSSESNVKQWTSTIAKIRESYKGNLTYSANWDHYTALPFWDQLDLIGMNSYYRRIWWNSPRKKGNRFCCWKPAGAALRTPPARLGITRSRICRPTTICRSGCMRRFSMSGTAILTWAVT